MNRRFISLRRHPEQSEGSMYFARSADALCFASKRGDLRRVLLGQDTSNWVNDAVSPINGGQTHHERCHQTLEKGVVTGTT